MVKRLSDIESSSYNLESVLKGVLSEKKES